MWILQEFDELQAEELTRKQRRVVVKRITVIRSVCSRHRQRSADLTSEIDLSQIPWDGGFNI